MRINFSSSVRPKSVAKKLKASLSFLGNSIKLSEAQKLTAHLYGYRSWYELHAAIGTFPQSEDDQQLAATVVAARSNYQVARLNEAGVPLNMAAYAVKVIGPTASQGAKFSSLVDAQGFFEELRDLIGATGFRFYTRGAGCGALTFRRAGKWVEDPIRRIGNAEQINKIDPCCAGLSAIWFDVR